MNAGKRELIWMRNALPDTDSASKEINWLSYIENGEKSDSKLQKDWLSGVPGSLAPCHLVIASIQCMRNRGYVVDKAEFLINEGLKALEDNDMGMLQKVTSKIYRELNNAEKDMNSTYWDYEIFKDWESIEARSTYPSYHIDLDKAELAEKIKAGWLGKLIGGALGTQVEGYTTENIQKVYGIVDRYLRKPETYNDDITYELVFLEVFRRKGYSITSNDIAEGWLDLIMDGYSAEEVALENLRKGIFPPESGTYLNYYSDWIGVQMRTAIHGMVTPGNPKLAAELAVRDGIISHSNSGLLGGVFNAVLVSLAYVEKDMKKLTEMTVDTLPKTSEYYEVASRALRDCKESTSWQEAWEKSSYILEEYNWVHVYPNVICEIIALWFGENDFDKTAAIITTLGLDSDCNAAPILNAMGIAYGMDIINNKWTEPLGEEIKTILRRYREINLNDLCNVTTKSITDAQNSVQTKNILLICTAGITSGVLVKSIDNYVREHNLNYNISSVSIGEARKEILRNDIILLSPQTGYLEKNIQEIISGKGIVKVIPGELYAWMDVESIIELIK